jgi:O-antigen/teichoic acid export membrane protein
MHEVYNSVTEWAALLVLPIYLAMVLVPDAILTTVFKAAYAGGTVPLVLIATGFFTHVLSGSCGDALIALGRTRLVLAGNVGSGVANVLLNIVLIPRAGITGAAAASAGTYALFNLFYLFWLNRETGILPFSRSFLTPLLGSTAVAGGVWVAAEAVFEFDVVSLAATLAATYLLHALVVVRTKETTRGDEQLLSKLEANLGVGVRDVLGRFR